MKSLRDLFSSPVALVMFGEKRKNLYVFLWILLLNTISALFEGSSFAFLFLALSVLSDIESSHHFLLNWFKQWTWFKAMNPSSMFLLFLLGAIATQIVRGVIGVLAMFSTLKLIIASEKEAINRFVRQMFYFTFPFFNQYKMGALADMLKKPQTCFVILLEEGNQCLASLLMCVVLMGLLVKISIPLTIVTGISYGLFAITHKWFMKSISHHSKEHAEHSMEFMKEFVQSLHGFRIIHVFNRIEETFRKLSHTLDRISKSHRGLRFLAYIRDFIAKQWSSALWGAFLIWDGFISGRS